MIGIAVLVAVAWILMIGEVVTVVQPVLMKEDLGALLPLLHQEREHESKNVKELGRKTDGVELVTKNVPMFGALVRNLARMSSKKKSHGHPGKSRMKMAGLL